MNITDRVRGALRRVGGRVSARGVRLSGGEVDQRRRTAPLPSILDNYGGRTGSASVMPKPTPANLRRFAETPVARKAINTIKDRIAGMRWRIQPRRGRSLEEITDGALRVRILTENFDAPNPDDSFRSLAEQVLEDVIVGGFGAIEMVAAGDPARPLTLWPVDGASIRMKSDWDGLPGSPRYVQVTGQFGPEGNVVLNDDELIYIRLNPRTHTPFGLGRLEVAFETVNAFLSAHRYAGRLASNSVVQYALWLQQLSPESHERVIRWWQDEIEPPVFEYLGWGERGPIYRYNVVALSDEVLLDGKRPVDRSPFVERSAGAALRQLAEDVMPGGFDTEQVQDLDSLPWYACDPTQKWSEHARRIALQARAVYRAIRGELVLAPVGEVIYALDEADEDFSPDGLKLQTIDGAINDVTIVGRVEPSAYVTDYFVGDGDSMRFYLSQTPFTRRNWTVVEEEYASLDPARWKVADPAQCVAVTGGKLQIEGGTGVDGESLVEFAEKVELGGAKVLQHGDVSFSASSDGVLGGLYPADVSIAGCLAGFRVLKGGATSSVIQALVNGGLTGPVVQVLAGRRYALTTRLYSAEIYRAQQTFHSAAHPAGQGRGGEAMDAALRVVLEAHEIDPQNPASLVSPSTVLYDGVIPAASGFCRYALVNAGSLHCSIAFTRILQTIDAEVRSAHPGEGYRTRLVGSLADGAECLLTQDGALQFFPQSVPAANELIEVRYRRGSRAVARVVDPASVAAKRKSNDDGVRGLVRGLKMPTPRTTEDCENAALAVLDNGSRPGWAGSYETWNHLLPGGAEDIFPGDAIEVEVPSRRASFRAIVRNVEIEVKQLEEEYSRYRIEFADDAVEPLALEFDNQATVDPLSVAPVNVDEVGTEMPPDLVGAAITQVTSTTVTVSAGTMPVAGGGIEVRWTDFGWGQENDRNLVGRFGGSTFTLPRLSRVQSYFLRQYDGANPPRYSRRSAALHVDYPL